jgi:ABC-type transport system involved in multi-copper enzyme maturation permease subunit
MFGPLFAFELRNHFRRPVTWLYVAIVFFMAFFAVSTESFVTGQVLGKVKKNSPYSLAQLYGVLLAVGQIITSALVGTTVLRDYEAGVHEILFSASRGRPTWGPSISGRCWPCCWCSRRCRWERWWAP